MHCRLMVRILAETVWFIIAQGTDFSKSMPEYPYYVWSAEIDSDIDLFL